jgi:uncharacterized protein (TIGR02246 family)
MQHSLGPMEMQQLLGALESIPVRMNEAWNRGDAVAFVADFADDAEFVAFDGTVLKGREDIIAYHQPLFDTALKGSQLVNGRVAFARIIAPGWGVVHHRVSVLMPGDAEPLPSRDSMQLIVARLNPERWEAAALQNSRVIALETQLTLDALATRPSN